MFGQNNTDSIYLYCDQNKTPVSIRKNIFEINIKSNATLFIDDTKKIGFDQAVIELSKCNFKSFRESSLPNRFNSGDKYTWCYFEVINNSKDTLPYLLTGNIHNDSIWILDKKESIGYKINEVNFKLNASDISISSFNKFYNYLPPFSTQKILLKQSRPIYDSSSLLPTISDYIKYESNYLAKKNILIHFYFFVFSFLCGILSILIIHFIYFRNKVIFYYCLYIISVMFITWRNFEWNQLHITTWIGSIPWFTTKIYHTSALFFSYSVFILTFLEFKTTYSRQLLKIIIGLLLIAMVIDIPLMLYFPHWSYTLYYSVRMLISMLGLFTFVLIWRTPHPLSKIVFIGTAILIVTELISNFVTGYLSSIIPTIGVMIEVLIFTSVLGIWSFRKYRDQLKLKSENEKLIADKNEVMAGMRRDFAQDIHDELGSTITKLMLEVYYQKSKSNNDDIKVLDNLQNNLNKLSSQIKDMIWLFDDGKTKFTELQSQIRETCNDFAFNSHISMTYDMPLPQKDIVLSLELKRHLLSIIKEAMTNIVKHSDATTINIGCNILQNCLTLSIEDNGNNQNSNQKSINGKGISNMKNRAYKIGGELNHTITTSGCKVIVFLDLSKEGVKTL